MKQLEEDAGVAATTDINDQIVFFNRFDVYHTSPDSGECQCKSTT